MQKKLLIILTVVLIIVGQALKAQIAGNLVPNFSFEEYTNYCGGDIYMANGWNIYLSTIYGSSGNTPDYFNICGGSGGYYGVPSNEHGYQYPATGNAYAGVFTYQLPFGNEREYIGIKLKNSLNKGQKYNVSFKISFGDNYNCCTNKMGMLFMTDSFNIMEPNNFAQIYFDSIITESVNWVTLSKSFVADSNYKYIVIGNFFDDNNTSYIKLYNDGSNCNGYYYVDDVYVGLDSTAENIDNYVNSKIKLSPNPFKEYTFFHCLVSIDKVVKFQLFDITGKEVTPLAFIEKHGNSEYLIKRNNLSEGIYILKSVFNNSIFINKLIITD